MKRIIFSALALGLLAIFIGTTVQAEPQYLVFEGQVDSIDDPTGFIAESSELKVGSEVTFTFLVNFEENGILHYNRGDFLELLDWETGNIRQDIFYADYISGSTLQLPNEGYFIRPGDYKEYNAGFFVTDTATNMSFERLLGGSRNNRVEIKSLGHSKAPGFYLGDKFGLFYLVNDGTTDRLGHQIEATIRGTLWLTQTMSYQNSITATVEITPNTLNIKSNGNWITAYIELPEGSNAYDIDHLSVTVNTINGEEVDNPLHAVGPTEVGDHDDDGTEDLMVKFDRQEFLDLVNVGDVEITLVGELVDGTTFKGTDTVRVVHNAKSKKK